MQRDGYALCRVIRDGLTESQYYSSKCRCYGMSEQYGAELNGAESKVASRQARVLLRNLGTLEGLPWMPDVPYGRIGGTGV